MPDDFLKLDGATISPSADTGSVLNNSFFSLYTHSDFLRFFKQIDNDHDKYKEDLDHHLTLECKSIIKFRPREGFYPSQRTLQLATLFSQSYAPVFTLEDDNASWRAALAPFYAPGIMYNTIKSGIAVDYPLIQSSSTPYIGVISSDLTNYGVDQFGFYPEIYQTTSRLYPSFNALTGTGLPYYFISSSFSHRLPFESIIDPLSLSNVNGIKFVDLEPHPSASLASGFTIKGKPRPSYKLAVDNFLAETINFYLQDGAMTSFTSKPQDSSGVALDTAKEYIMDIKLSRDSKNLKSIDLSPSALSESVLVAATASFLDKDIEIYERETAFGPPVLEYFRTDISHPSGAPSNFWRTSTYSCAPFTPPYFDGFSRVRVSFKPTSTSHTLREIVNNSTKTYFRNGILDSVNSYTSYAKENAMQISASINFEIVLETKTVERDKQGNLISVTEQPGSKGSQWVIEPKFETPILDFSDVSITTPLSGAGSISKGMWHQNGALPQTSATTAVSKGGLFLDLEFPTEDVVTTSTTGSLISVLGFDEANGGVLSKRLGNTSTSTVVSEAVVAIPFYSKTETINNFDELHFLPLVSDAPATMGLSPSRAAVYEAAITIASEGTYEPQIATPAIIDMVRKMQKYILPPKFDFLKFFAEREPFAMYIFDFEHEFDRSDLINMWQNVSPVSGQDFKIMTSTVSHKIDAQNLGGDFTDKLGQLRWMVFKVKQKAEKFYLNKTLSAFDKPEFVKAFSAQNKEDLEKTTPYSYNWPYDYFSLVELIKVDADVNLEEDRGKRKETREKPKNLSISKSTDSSLSQAASTPSSKLALKE